MDPISTFLLSKALTFGFDTYLQPFIKDTSNTLEQIADLLIESSERERIGLLREALLHLQLESEDDRHRNKAQDLLIQACASDPYAAVPIVLHGLLLMRKESTKAIGLDHVNQSLRLNPMILVEITSHLPYLDNQEQLLNIGSYSEESSAELTPVWTLDLNDCRLPLLNEAPKRTILRRYFQRLNTLVGVSVSNSQRTVSAAAVNSQSLFISWIASANLRQGGESLLSRVDTGRAAWTIRETDELPILAGDVFVLTEGVQGKCVGRGIENGRVLFRASKDYVRAMISPTLDQANAPKLVMSASMHARSSDEVLNSLSQREDDAGYAVAQPGFDHIVAEPHSIIEEFVLRAITSNGAYIIRNGFHHWHQETLGNQQTTCMLTGKAIISSAEKPD